MMNPISHSIHHHHAHHAHHAHHGHGHGNNGHPGADATAATTAAAAPRWRVAVGVVALGVGVITMALGPMPTAVAIPSAPLPSAVTLAVGDLVGAAERAGGQIGVYCIAPDGTLIFAHQADRALIPASNQKLFTTAAALTRLGADFHFTTALFAHGQLVRAPGRPTALMGDLVVVGDGDPTISRRFDPNRDPRAVFRRWATALRETHGLTAVSGALVCDATIFDREFVHPTWPRDQLLNWYEAPVSGLAFEDNCFRLIVTPTPNGPRVEADPPTAAVVLGNSVTVGGTGHPQISLAPTDRPGMSPSPLVARQLSVRGRIPANSRPYSTDVTVHDPVVYFGTVLLETLAAEGISVAGGWRIAETKTATGGLLRLHAERTPLPVAVQVCNERSQNFYAEQIFKRLGAAATNQPGSFATGAAGVMAFARQIGIPAGEIAVADGSGMSRDNRCTPRALGALLYAMHVATTADNTAPIGRAFVDSLAVAGESGTLQNRLPHLRGRVVGKTGTLNGVYSLAGFLRIPTADGAERLYPFAILTNGMPTATAGRNLLDSVTDRLYRHASSHAAAR